MTPGGRVSGWIRGRSPAPPPQLLARIDTMAVGDGAPGAAAADALLDVAEASMRTVLRDGCLTRNSALDLLAVDAIMTYAFEAAADDAAGLEQRTETALARIADLARPYHD